MATKSKTTPATAKPVKSVPIKKAPAKAVSVKPTPPKKVNAPAVKLKAPAVKLKASTAPKPILNTEQRNHYVAVAAFYIAEQRGFTLGNPQEDWLAAEAEIDRLIASGHFSF